MGTGANYINIYREMRCKKHPADQSCTVGVCASCLRERLLAVITAQVQAQALKQALQESRKSDGHRSFPRSVSPYISRRKSDAAATIAVEINSSRRSRFSSLFGGIFRSKPEKRVADPVSYPNISVHSCSASPAWFPNIISGLRKKKISTFSMDATAIRTNRNRGRGLSPERGAGLDGEYCDEGSSGYSSETQGWRQTPRRTPATTRRNGGRATKHSKSLSGLTLCLSPLVRPSPNRHWNQKITPPDTVIAGYLRSRTSPQRRRFARIVPGNWLISGGTTTTRPFDF